MCIVSIQQIMPLRPSSTGKWLETGWGDYWILKVQDTQPLVSNRKGHPSTECNHEQVVSFLVVDSFCLCRNLVATPLSCFMALKRQKKERKHICSVVVQTFQNFQGDLDKCTSLNHPYVLCVLPFFKKRKKS